MVGLTTAYHLAGEGAEVTLVDARGTGLGTSKVNAGWVCPAESAPVPGPGVILQSMKWILRPDNPLYFKPSLEPAFLKFLTGMWRHSNAKAQRAGFEGHIALAQETIEVFDDYRSDGMDFEMHTSGCSWPSRRRTSSTTWTTSTWPGGSAATPASCAAPTPRKSCDVPVKVRRAPL